MSIKVIYECSICSARAEGTESLRREWAGVYSAGAPIFGGFVTAEDANTVESVVPEGWVPFDPYTLFTYCPACWAQIEEDVSDG